MEEPRSLVGVSWMVKRTGLDRATVKRGAASGRIPGATKLLGVWRFDPQAVEQWIADGQPKPQQTTAPAASASFASPEPRSDQQRRAEAPPTSASTPPLVVLFPHAAHRGINDQPAEQPARQAGRRGTRTRRAALPI